MKTQPAAYKADLQSILEPLDLYLKGLDDFLTSQVKLLEPEVQEQAAYVLANSGKRLRPILVAYSGWKKDVHKDADLIRLGAILELVHLATLVHDDILDNAAIRHGAPTVSAKYGSDAAVLVGDILFAHALCLASEFKTTDVCRAVAKATADVCSGEISQTYSKKVLNFDRAHYFRVIRLKTAELFGVACHLGAIVSGKSVSTSKAVKNIGLYLGSAYQIFDDVVDLFEEESKIGKTLGTDLENGKFTLPLLILIEALPPAERFEWIEQYNDGKREATEKLQALLKEYPILQKVKVEFSRCLESANKELRNLNDIDKEHFLLLISFVGNLFYTIKE